MRCTIFLLAFLSAALGACGQATGVEESTLGNIPATATPSVGPSTGEEILLQLSWQPNSDPVAGYIVYYGPSGDQATIEASDLALTAAGFDPLAPNVTYNAARDLGLRPGSAVCFRLRAYNSQAAFSPWSTSACTTI